MEPKQSEAGSALILVSVNGFNEFSADLIGPPSYDTQKEENRTCDVKGSSFHYSDCFCGFPCP